ncbi:hypothetical protein B5C34_10300 [Pacificimonas flava]|uniref:Glycerophosphoryl diester phosphodiesterase membrane domain-containing protein n=2 Tax=Pacificimonas TaxID=1960290 RepID=A0A219B5Z8_9SPHN|nr:MULTISPECIES: hypothetical protein [Pacificimonas]MBZ6378941.1 hypothetical protein [Pacificimonas aurantium]OWV33812.1 hypothetical protein B5C34_10300 [Pacificimonas flava]
MPTIFVQPILRTTIETWWRDFAPITMLGLLILTGTELVIHLMGVSGSMDPSTATLIQTARAAAFALFVSAVSAGTMLRLAGMTRRPGTYMLASLKLAQPGLLTALTLAALVFGLLIVDLLLGAVIGGMSRVVILPAILFMLACLLPAIPVSIEERLPPLSALRRAAGMTKTHRGPILGLLLLVFAILLLPAMLVFAVVYGPVALTAEGSEDLAATLPALSITRPGFWIVELSSLMFNGLIAVVPPTVYLALRAAERTG